MRALGSCYNVRQQHHTRLDCGATDMWSQLVAAKIRTRPTIASGMCVCVCARANLFANAGPDTHAHQSVATSNVAHVNTIDAGVWFFLFSGQ